MFLPDIDSEDRRGQIVGMYQKNPTHSSNHDSLAPKNTINGVKSTSNSR